MSEKARAGHQRPDFSKRLEDSRERRGEMRIVLWRKVLATDYSHTSCGICGNDFDRGTVFPVAFTDNRESIGEMCPPCLDYVNRRKQDAGDPTLENWPAREWPRLEDLEEARRRYPEAMFPDHAALDAAASAPDTEQVVLQSSFVWSVEREAGG
jgi:hypothetical protein